MRLKKAIIVFVIILALCIVAFAVQNNFTAKKTYPVTGEFETVVLKEGKADAIILMSSNQTMVIDCGEKGDGKDVLNFLEQRGIEKIDYLIITHFDQDHVGGAAKVINNIPIGEILVPNYEGSNKEYTSFIDAVNENGYLVTVQDVDRDIIMDDVYTTVFAPLKDEYPEPDNEFSLVVKAIHGNNKFLFAADAERERLKELYSQAGANYDFLKVPHHGVFDKDSAVFIKRISPQISVITCSDSAPADEAVLHLLETFGKKTYLTMLGDVTAVSDGNQITVTQGDESLVFVHED